jgi:hypothetical protein
MFAAGKTDGAAAVAANYIEDVFSTYLYTGNGSTQTITNGIDLSTKGGIVWCKGRSAAGYSNVVYDTINGVNKRVATNLTSALTTAASSLTAFNTTGFSLGADAGGEVNENATNYVSWTFRKQPKFFDVLTYTGNGANRNITHNLGSVPGCIIIKRTDTTENWIVYHRSLGNDYELFLNLTLAQNYTNDFNFTTPTSSVFSVNGNDAVNASSGTYVAYLFAHDAGGFGLTGTDNVISCGSYTGNGSASGPTISLGYEPQWLMVKRATGGTGNWVMIDSMRGFVNSTTATPSDAYLVANTSAAESTWGDFTGSENAAIPLATGFQIVTSTAALNNSSNTYIYIAIRRGPMKVPTSGSSVFAPVLQNGGNVSITTNFPVDLLISKPPASAGQAPYFMDRLRGGTTSNYVILMSSNADAEITGTGTGLGFQSNTAIQSQNSFYSSSTPVIWLNFRRAPSFFDEVCYTGVNPGSATLAVTHNLTVTPELVIIRERPGYDWLVYSATTGTANTLFLNLANAVVGYQFLTSPSASTITVGAVANNDTSTYVAYLFATCPNVSKVGSYTGNGTTQTINCGFTGGARFVLIKRTDSTGGWYVYDTARGMTVLTDPYLLLNTTAAQVATLGSVTTVSTGFALNSSILADINVSSGTYIFLAIA